MYVGWFGLFSQSGWVSWSAWLACSLLLWGLLVFFGVGFGFLPVLVSWLEGLRGFLGGFLFLGSIFGGQVWGDGS